MQHSSRCLKESSQGPVEMGMYVTAGVTVPVYPCKKLKFETAKHKSTV